MSERTALDQILGPGGLRPMYQAVVHVSGAEPKLHYYECLMRGPKGTNMETANVLFDYVRFKREEISVDRACVTAALEGGAQLPTPAHFSINVHASTLGRDQDFVSFVTDESRRFGVAPDRLTIEIVEHAPPWDNDSFLASLERLRDAGCRIALDDVGLGQSNYKMIFDVCPDYLKIDRYFVSGCTADTKRQAVIESIHQLALRFGARVIAEGVETEADCDALLALDIHLMQGYLFAHAESVADLRLAAAASDNRSLRQLTV